MKLHDIWRLNEVNSNFELNFLVLSKIIWGQATLIWSLKSQKFNASNGMQIEIETKKVIVKWDQVEKWVWLHVKIVDQANSTIILVEIISTWHIINETSNFPCQKILTIGFIQIDINYNSLRVEKFCASLAQRIR